MFGAVIAFWSAPFTPAMPLQLALAVGLKKLYHAIKKRKSKKKEEAKNAENQKRR